MPYSGTGVFGHWTAGAGQTHRSPVPGPRVTTNLVVAEMQVLLTRFRGADEGRRFLDSLYRDASHRVVFVDRDLERSATENWLRRFRDQRLSLADAVSFEVMRTENIGEALALDAHFEVAGFGMRP